MCKFEKNQSTVLTGSIKVLIKIQNSNKMVNIDVKATCLTKGKSKWLLLENIYMLRLESRKPNLTNVIPRESFVLEQCSD